MTGEQIGLLTALVTAASAMILSIINRRGKQRMETDKRAEEREDLWRDADGMLEAKGMDDATAIRKELRDDNRLLKEELRELRDELEECKTKHISADHKIWQLEREINDLRERLGLVAHVLTAEPPRSVSSTGPDS